MPSTPLTWIEATYQITHWLLATGGILKNLRITHAKVTECCASETRGTYISHNSTPKDRRDMMLHLGHHNSCLPLEVIDSSNLNRYSMTMRYCWDAAGNDMLAGGGTCGFFLKHKYLIEVSV